MSNSIKSDNVNDDIENIYPGTSDDALVPSDNNKNNLTVGELRRLISKMKSKASELQNQNISDASVTVELVKTHNTILTEIMRSKLLDKK